MGLWTCLCFDGSENSRHQQWWYSGTGRPLLYDKVPSISITVPALLMFFHRNILFCCSECPMVQYLPVCSFCPYTVCLYGKTFAGICMTLHIHDKHFSVNLCSWASYNYLISTWGIKDLEFCKFIIWWNFLLNWWKGSGMSFLFEKSNQPMWSRFQK